MGYGSFCKGDGTFYNPTSTSVYTRFYDNGNPNSAICGYGYYSVYVVASLRDISNRFEVHVVTGPQGSPFQHHFPS